MDISSERNQVDFEPISLVIVIKSKEELDIMWNIFNRSVDSVIKDSRKTLIELSLETHKLGTIATILRRVCGTLNKYI